jgi:hypothetical protein
MFFHRALCEIVYPFTNISKISQIREDIPISTRIASGESKWDLTQRKVDYWWTNEVKNLKKVANPQAFTVE